MLTWIDTYTFPSDLTEKTCRLREICLPPSSASPTSPKEASKASKSSSLNGSVELSTGASGGFSGAGALSMGAIFQRRMVASWEPDARINVSS